ncbi:MAG: hypothetical protein H7A40_05400 [Chlamydiales bacterium]|nr:hypothetical protein [Chlamydiales bacterium]
MKTLMISLLAITAFAGVSGESEDLSYTVFEAGEVVPLKMDLSSPAMEVKGMTELTFKKTTYVRVEPESGIFISTDGEKWVELPTYFGCPGYAGGLLLDDDGKAIEADFAIMGKN